MNKTLLLFFFLTLLHIGCSDDLVSSEEQAGAFTGKSLSQSLGKYKTGVFVFNSNDPVDVRIAQHHVLHPEDEYFKLVSEKPARLLVKLNENTQQSHETLHLWITESNGTVHKKTMDYFDFDCHANYYAPEIINNQYDELVCNIHQFDLNAEWIKPGMTLDIRSASESLMLLDNLKIGAPNPMDLKMINIHFFEELANANSLDNLPGWEKDFAAKLPISRLNYSLAPDVVFEELTVVPRGNFPAIRCSSKQDYEAKARQYFIDNPRLPKPGNYRFDGTVSTTTAWRTALLNASGTSNFHASYWVGMYNGEAEGNGGGLQANGNANKHGFLMHEFGHAFNLRHAWLDKNEPYNCSNTHVDVPCPTEITGIPSWNGPNTGMSWGYDALNKKYIAPTVQIDGHPKRGQYKKTPQNGGGEGWQDSGYFNHHSDYQIEKMRAYFESKHLYYDNQDKFWKRWNVSSEEYEDKFDGNVKVPWVPLWENIEVYSIMLSISSNTPNANIVYPPIGPYTAGTNPKYDPTKTWGRNAALSRNYCPNNSCDYTLRYKQGGKYFVSMLPISKNNQENPLKANGLDNFALNVPTKNGEITEMAVYYTPNVANNGISCNKGWVINCPLITSWSQD